jgi:NTP pyrophosphatase (non-canonical NTP hydrolase)
MISLEDHHLLLLMEECAEVAHAASKQLRFGADQIQPGQPHQNQTRLRMEILDLLACIRFLEQSGQIAKIYYPVDLDCHMHGKQPKIDAALRVSRAQGRLEAEAFDLPSFLGRSRE